jgi:serine protease Do
MLFTHRIDTPLPSRERERRKKQKHSQVWQNQIKNEEGIMRKIKYVMAAVVLGVVAAGLLAHTVYSPGHLPYQKSDSYQTPYIFTSETGELVTLQNAFVQIAKAVKPSVVQITTEKTVTLRYWDPFGDFEGLFRSPFEDFFNAPRRQQQPRTFERKQQGLGSGFIVDEEGYIITNNHVISGVDKIFVKLQDDDHNYKAEVVGTDPKTDLSLIKIDGKKLLPAVRLGDSDKIQPGEWVMAIGNPMGLSATITVGIVSAKGRTGFGITQYEDFIQTDAAINPGNSGGPLVNINAEVVGINTFIVSPQVAENLGFAIPVNIAKQIFSQLKEQGRVVRGYLGVYLQPLDEELSKSFNLKDMRGALVADVIPDTPAEKAGIQEGDIILEFDGKDISDVKDLQMKVAGTAVGKKIPVVVWRNGKKIALTMVIGEMPSEEEMAKVSGKEVWRGMHVSAITPEIKQRLEITDEEGMVVISVEPGSPAEDANISSGTLIKAIDGKKIKDVSDYSKVTKNIPAEKDVRLLVKQGNLVRFVILKGEK